eukprot:CAMPEP_0202941202 /NCGR_PEP_ID=MMETSP1395-20130829/1325_1 /ASSEMBLY_ACC=CAM_ASM_000871 /TAXON_ID=5961 /ORGANISM="Blepharisma japonicum, Strain Stock R1072" /LENGTH=94 /DNA_ID=CAMNT_0049636211 /DNA_START=42 /DNA_END=326 /DNA_ORIENTATION=-
MMKPFPAAFSIRAFSASQSSVEQAIIERLKETEGIKIEKLSPNSSFKEIKLDSLAQIELFSYLEEKFDVTLNDNDTEGVKGVNDLVKIILGKFK